MSNSVQWASAGSGIGGVAVVRASSAVSWASTQVSTFGPLMYVSARITLLYGLVMRSLVRLRRWKRVNSQWNDSDLDLVPSKIVGGTPQSGVAIVGWVGGAMGGVAVVTVVVIAVRIAGVCGWASRG